MAILAEHGPNARLLAGGTDLIIRLRDGTLRPATVVDLKGIPELAPSITEVDGFGRFSAATTMTDVHDSSLVRRWFPALRSDAISPRSS